VITIRFARAYLKAGISAEGRVEEYDESVEENSQSTNTRVREPTVRGFESRRFESSRVREFELDNGVIPTVKSEANKESEN
jgi:hypothetical protein